MALTRRGLRHIQVAGISYGWSIRRKPTYSQGNGWGGLAVAIARDDCQGQILHVELHKARLDAWLGSHAPPVTPRLVAGWIVQALALGWQPCTPGNAFEMRVHV